VEKEIKLYSYILKHDTGFAPNPYHGICTLACCKPDIRKNIGRNFDIYKDQFDFWVVGISSADKGENKNKLVYAMRVTEVLTFDKYFEDGRFLKKIPKWENGNFTEKAGDNIYKYKGHGNRKKADSYEQLKSYHNNSITEKKINENSNFHKKRDLEQGEFYILISEEFYYFGKHPQIIDRSLVNLYKAETGFHIRQKFNFDKKTLDAFKKYILELKKVNNSKSIISNTLNFKNRDSDSNQKNNTSCA